MRTIAVAVFVSLLVVTGGVAAQPRHEYHTTHVRTTNYPTEVQAWRLAFPSKQDRQFAKWVKAVSFHRLEDFLVIIKRNADEKEARLAQAAAEAARAVERPARPASRVASSNVSTGTGVWDRLAQCESGGNWAINTGNSFYGGLQFTIGSWHAVGMSGRPDQASRETQIQAGVRLQALQGWGAWPVCSRKIGLR